ncbi:macro domain-containing protein [Kiritimatiellota bacterium B12222]|nr:macro domain-containing protein [Kiritimatiellota bacterium B12222]
MEVRVVEGDLLEQKVEAIVNAWNRNIIPWWLLIPQGVSGAIKHRGGFSPFRELGRRGSIPLGSAVLTGSGRLPFKGIIHVAGINMLWRASESSIRDSVSNAMEIAINQDYLSVAFPIIGAGSGGFNTDSALELMKDQFSFIDSNMDVAIVRYMKTKTNNSRHRTSRCG